MAKAFGGSLVSRKAGLLNDEEFFAAVDFEQMLDIIFDTAQRTIDEIYKETKKGEGAPYWKNRTGNLAHSYGFGIYYNGQRWRTGFVSDSLLPPKTEMRSKKHEAGKGAPGAILNNPGKEWYDGREQIELYLQYAGGVNSEIKGKRGFKVIFAVAMWYGQILEEGSNHLKNKYHVIVAFKDLIRRRFESEIDNDIRRYMATPYATNRLKNWYEGTMKDFIRIHSKM